MNRVSRTTVALIATLTLISCAQEKNESKTQLSARQGNTEAVPGQAPAFTLQNAQGQNVSLADFKGKVLILDFWATWCPPCRDEIPHFIELLKEYGEKGLQVVGVSVDQQGWDVVKPFIEQNHMNYPVLMADKEVYKAYQEIIEPNQRGGIPFTFVIDRNGKITEQFVGYRDKSVFEAAIKPLL